MFADLTTPEKIIFYLFVVAISFVFSRPTGMGNDEKGEQAMKTLNRLDNLTFGFDCAGRAIGFYADVEYDCQIFHMCDEKGKRIPHACANDTSFNQEFRICDWEYNFNCSEAPKWYFLNDLTYATEPSDLIIKK